MNELKRINLSTNNLIVNRKEYDAYLNSVKYDHYYPSYYIDNLHEKSLEHFLTLQLLSLRTEDVFIDIASEHSLLPGSLRRMLELKYFHQDIIYQAGINGDKTGGDACAMPVDDNICN